MGRPVSALCPRSAPAGAPLAGTGKLNGRSEQLLGRFVDEYPGSAAVRDNVRIATKLAAYPWRLTPQQAGTRAGAGCGVLFRCVVSLPAGADGCGASGLVVCLWQAGV